MQPERTTTSTPITAVCTKCGQSFTTSQYAVNRGRGRHCSRTCAYADYPKTALADRFWAKVQMTDGCWLWTAKCDHGGYGRLYDGVSHHN